MLMHVALQPLKLVRFVGVGVRCHRDNWRIHVHRSSSAVAFVGIIQDLALWSDVIGMDVLEAVRSQLLAPVVGRTKLLRMRWFFCEALTSPLAIWSW
jgi:hypothetical protein